jgi:hypothetical protein
VSIRESPTDDRDQGGANPPSASCAQAARATRASPRAAHDRSAARIAPTSVIRATAVAPLVHSLMDASMARADAFKTLVRASCHLR